MCGIEINCFLCSECSLKSIERVSEASLNIVLNPEYGCDKAILLEKMYRTPYYICDGPPVGFTASEKFIGDICEILNKGCTFFMKESEKSRE